MRTKTGSKYNGPAVSLLSYCQVHCHLDRRQLLSWSSPFGAILRFDSYVSCQLLSLSHPFDSKVNEFLKTVPKEDPNAHYHDMPDDPDENNEFEQWVYFENGKMITARRPNPKFRGRKSQPLPDGRIGSSD